MIPRIKPLILSFFIVAGLTSCGKDVPETNQDEEKLKRLNELVSDAQYEVLDKVTLNVEQMADKLYGKAGANGADNDARRAAFIKRNQMMADSLANIKGVNGVSIMYTYWNYNFSSKDQKGDPIRLSAFMSAGSYWFFGTEFTDQDNIYLICPYTHTQESQCATESDGGYEFDFFVSTDNLFIMPDGQGFGYDKGHTQPYLDHNTQAKQIYDALKAGYKIYTNDGGKMESNYHLRVVGASQGAGDAIAVHKLLDTQKNDDGLYLKDVWNFQYSYACSGPYNPVETMKYYYEVKKLEYPVVLPLVVKSMLGCNPDLAAKYNESDFYSDKYNALKSKYDEIYLNKPLDAADINKEMAKDFNTEEDKTALGSDSDDHVFIYRLFSEAMRDTNSQMYKDFMACLEKQDLTTGWKPFTQTYLMASKGDCIVPPVNTEKLLDLFNSCSIPAHMDWTELELSHTEACLEFMFSSW